MAVSAMIERKSSGSGFLQPLRELVKKSEISIDLEKQEETPWIQVQIRVPRDTNDLLEISSIEISSIAIYQGNERKR